MSAGSHTALIGDARDEAQGCVQCSILNVGGGDTHIRLDDEAVTAAALRELGMERLRARDDSIMAVVVEQGPAACLAWALLRTCLLAAVAPGGVCRTWVPLLELLQPFLAWDATTEFRYHKSAHPALLPFRGDDWDVCLTEGRRGDADEWAGCSPLSLLAAHPTALVHHLRADMAGPSLMFLARRRDMPHVTKPVLLQLLTDGTGGLEGALRALDLGNMHPDQGGLEVPAHADMRATLAAHPEWALPIRCVVATQPFASQVLRDAAWLNRTVLWPSRLVLMQLTAANLGRVDITPAGAAAAVLIACPRAWPACTMPLPVRHWAGAPLPALAASPDLRVASQRVRFSSASATKDELVEAVDAVVFELGGDVAYSRHWLRRAVTATFTNAAPAIEALLRCRNGRLTAGGAAVTAAFV